MCNSDFCNHHAHSSYSFGDSILGVDKLVKKAKELGNTSVTLTDHGSLVGMVPFVKEAEKQGIKWIIGMESYYVDDELKDTEKKSRHLTTMVANEKGWENQLQLTWFANVPVKDGGGFFYRPRFTDKEIFKHQEGLIFSSACLNGVIASDLMKDDEMSARLTAMKWRDNVENFFIEIMPHRFDEQIKMNAKLIKIARDLGIPILATLDVHYEEPKQHDSWLINGAMRRRQTVETFESHEITPDMYFKGSEQIIQDFRFGGVSDDVIREAMENSLRISEMCNFKWKDRMNTQPVFNASLNAPDHLKTIAWQGLCKRFGGAKLVPQSYVNRLKYEWEVVCQMGYADYFLILHDFISYAKNNDVVCGPGRGSGCGSLMLWALHVTEVDSIKYKLPFERFLNIERTGTAPDYDADIDPKGRAKVINYMKEKYGTDHVFQVCVHSELKPKSVIKDVARYYNYAPQDSQMISDLIPIKYENDEGEKVTPTISEVVKMDSMKGFVRSDPKLFEVAQDIEGSYRQPGRHAGAVIITSKPVTKILPVMRTPGENEDDYALQTQWDKKQLEEIGIHKYDILGLTTLTTLSQLEKTIGIKCVDIPMDDPITWKFLKKAQNMTGIFQLGASQSMRSWCRKVIPEWEEGSKNLVDYLSDVNAINRPAVLDAGLGDLYVNNLNSGKYDLEFDYGYIRLVLDSTNGVILYQEQVQFLANEIAGFSLGKGDLLRRNFEKMGTAGERTEKVLKENKQFKDEFIKGAIDKHGYSQKLADGLFHWLSESSGYGFNKAHSWTYSLIGYWTAYFKANYPIEFYCVSINDALEKNVAKDKDNPVELIVKEAQNVGIEVVVTNNENPSMDCVIMGEKIVFGLKMVKGFSKTTANLITKQKFESLKHFFELVSSHSNLNKKHIEILIKLGYLNDLETNKGKIWQDWEKFIWNKENEDKYADWLNRKNAGSRVRNYTEPKFKASEIEINSKRQTYAELLGFDFISLLTEKSKTVPDFMKNEDEWLLAEVSDSKSGKSKNGYVWKMLMLNTKNGQMTAFLKDPNQMFRKGEIIAAQYETKDGNKGPTTSLLKIVKL